VFGLEHAIWGGREQARTGEGRADALIDYHHIGLYLGDGQSGLV
jgi:hypothetical protein